MEAALRASACRIYLREIPRGVSLFRKFERVLKPFDASSALPAQSKEECDE